jgi:hypothetical protein
VNFAGIIKDEAVMTQALDPIPTDCFNSILCCYVNVTNQIQVARISDVPNWYFERVVFPGQKLLFESPSEAHLEIHTGMASTILADRIACQYLRVCENEPFSHL